MNELLPANFWLPRNHQTRVLSAEQIEELKTCFQLTFPAILLEIWRSNPGHGKPRDRMYVWPPEATHPFQNFKIVFFSDFQIIDLQTKMVGGILEVEELEQIEMLAIGEPEIGDEFVCLDFRQSSAEVPPSVVYMAYGNHKINHLAPSLEAFIQCLRRYRTDDCYCLEWSGSYADLWQRIITEFDLKEVEGEFGRRPDWDVWFSLHPNTDGEMREPFLEYPAERWILEVCPENKYRAEVRQSLDKLRIPWILAYEADG